MKLDNRCSDWMQTAIYKSKDAAAYYAEMRIAEEKCQSGKNLHFCRLKEVMKNNMEIAQQQLDDSLLLFDSNCVLHGRIDDFGGARGKHIAD